MKKNPADLTLRNLHAQKRRLVSLERRVRVLEAALVRLLRKPR